jgi:uncharacterized phiE125 gp8 family phage protein
VGWTLVTPPAELLLPLQVAKDWLRVDVSDEDSLIEDCISAAQEDLEGNYELALLTQTWDWTQDNFPGLGLFPWSSVWNVAQNRPVEIPRPPLQSVVSLTYTDSTDASTVITFPDARFTVDTSSVIGRVAPKVGQTWPSASLQTISAVTWRVKLGFGDHFINVPFKARQAARLLVGHYYANREQVLLEQRVRAIDIPRGVDDLMSPLNWRSFVA